MSLETILESALRAPSGDNCQPWQLEVAGDKINIFNVPSRDTSLFNHSQRASLIALGALIENISIASGAFGFETHHSYFPDRTQETLVATVSLEKSEVRNEPLYPFIAARATNRKPYRNTPLTPEQKDILRGIPGTLNYGKLRLFEGTELERISDAVAINDRIVFENPHLHRFLFDHIRWTEAEASATGDGLYIKTLELSSANELGFRFLRYWPFVSSGNPFGLSKIVGRQARKLCLSAPALGLVTCEADTHTDYLKNGRVIQRLWLEATQMGLSFQPMTGITFLIQRVASGETSLLSSSSINLIQEAHEKIRSVCDLGNEAMAMLFRVGYSNPPGVRSARLPQKTVIKSQNRI